MQGKILVIDNERRMCHVLKSALELDKHEVEVAYDGEAGLKKIRQNEFDVVITDLKMPGMDGIGVLEQVKKISPRAEVILMTAYATAQTAVEAMRKGAYDYLVKPFQIQTLLLTISRGFEKQKLSLENKRLISDLIRKNQILTETLDKLTKTQAKLVQSERTAAVIETVIAMKHEINNPLTGILNKLQILQERYSGTQKSELISDLKIIHDATVRISDTIEKLDRIGNPVSTTYTEGVSMLDIGASKQVRMGGSNSKYPGATSFF